MKKLILTLLIIAGALAAYYHRQGLSPQEVWELAKAAWEKEIARGRSGGETAQALASGAREFAAETADAVSAIIPTTDDLIDMKVKLDELRKRRVRREAELEVENAMRSPYAAEAVKRKRAFDEALAAAKKAAEAYGGADARTAKAHHALSRARVDFTRANELHRKWKAAHAAELKTPDKDEECRRLQEEIEALSQKIEGTP